MGRPFASEMAALPSTYTWARDVDVRLLASAIATLAARPLLVVGSGGSVSGGHFVARLHEEYARQPVRVVTPYEFVLLPPDGLSGVLLLSAGGSNPDILSAADHALLAEYPAVAAIVARADSPLAARLGAGQYATCFEFTAPTPKDGFLATNSLIATVALAERAYARAFGQASTLPPELVRSASPSCFALERSLLTVLGAGWAWPATLDLESKCNEAGLGVVTYADYRNFAHGRHHGLATRGATSGVVALITPDVEAMAERTLRAIPTSIPVTRIATEVPGPAGAVDLLIQVFAFVARAGECAKVDPGRPSVAPFGRRLYHMRMPMAGAMTRRRLVDHWIQRKVTAPVWAAAADAERAAWRDAYETWATHMAGVQVTGIVFDYDGTICEPGERETVPRAAVGTALTDLLEREVTVGVATGRGDSVITALRAVVPKRHHGRIVLGLYNGSIITRLSDPIPVDGESHHALVAAHTMVQASPVIASLVEPRLRPTQLTLRQQRPLPTGTLRRMVLELLTTAPDVMAEVAVHESGHTIDIIPRDVSKLRVVECVAAEGMTSAERRSARLTSAVVTIGDQGLLNGNDFEFLARPEGLSVERVSTSLDRCWNLTTPGRRGSAALLDYLAAVRTSPAGSRFDVRALEAAGRP